jgi:hypothetical protein
VAFVFVHDNCTDVEAGVALNEVAAVVGPEIILRNARPNPLTDPPPNVVKNGDISYLTLVCTANILNMGKYLIWYSGHGYISALSHLLIGHDVIIYIMAVP